jgi:hypothetical protein
MDTFSIKSIGTSDSKNGKQEVLLHPSFLETPSHFYKTVCKDRIRKQYLIIKMFYK